MPVAQMLNPEEGGLTAEEYLGWQAFLHAENELKKHSTARAAKGLR